MTDSTHDWLSADVAMVRRFLQSAADDRIIQRMSLEDRLKDSERRLAQHEKLLVEGKAESNPDGVVLEAMLHGVLPFCRRFEAHIEGVGIRVGDVAERLDDIDTFMAQAVGKRKKFRFHVRQSDAGEEFGGKPS